MFRFRFESLANVVFLQGLDRWKFGDIWRNCFRAIRSYCICSFENRRSKRQCSNLFGLDNSGRIRIFLSTTFLSDFQSTKSNLRCEKIQLEKSDFSFLAQLLTNFFKRTSLSSGRQRTLFILQLNKSSSFFFASPILATSFSSLNIEKQTKLKRLETFLRSVGSMFNDRFYSNNESLRWNLAVSSRFECLEQFSTNSFYSRTFATPSFASISIFHSILFVCPFSTWKRKTRFSQIVNDLTLIQTKKKLVEVFTRNSENREGKNSFETRDLWMSTVIVRLWTSERKPCVQEFVHPLKRFIKHVRVRAERIVRYTKYGFVVDTQNRHEFMSLTKRQTSSFTAAWFRSSHFCARWNS